MGLIMMKQPVWHHVYVNSKSRPPPPPPFPHPHKMKSDWRNEQWPNCRIKTLYWLLCAYKIGMKGLKECQKGFRDVIYAVSSLPAFRVNLRRQHQAVGFALCQVAPTTLYFMQLYIVWLNSSRRPHQSDLLLLHCLASCFSPSSTENTLTR